ncbi:MAG: hypothetical protein IJS07_09010 [Bacteroidales bacterium]|nr:hypothetical protein [Bacteroidales bacterium]
MSAAFEELLARDGYLVYKTHGVSMEPMLRQNRDLVTIRVPASHLKKYDVWDREPSPVPALSVSRYG